MSFNWRNVGDLQQNVVSKMSFNWRTFDTFWFFCRGELRGVVTRWFVAISFGIRLSQRMLFHSIACMKYINKWMNIVCFIYLFVIWWFDDIITFRPHQKQFEDAYKVHSVGSHAHKKLGYSTTRSPKIAHKELGMLWGRSFLPAMPIKNWDRSDKLVNFVCFLITCFFIVSSRMLLYNYIFFI